MGFFSRNKEATETGPVADVPFETLRRHPRDRQSAQRARETRFDAPSPLDPAETAKTRARRRLIGAIALALAAVVFVPMLFDRTPVPNTDDIELQIPDRDTPFEGRRGVPDPSRGPLKGSTDLPITAPVAAAPSPPVPVVTDATDKPVEKVVEKPVEQVTEKAKEPADAPPKPVEKSTAKVAPAAVPDKPKPAAPTDDPKALAALEGKPEQALAAGGDGKGYAVQVAAFSAAEKARGLRDQLVAGGMKSYIETVSTAQGPRVRVRLGPFPSRDAADRAKQKLKSMKLDGSVVPL
jgi:DedD protein